MKQDTHQMEWHKPQLINLTKTVRGGAVDDQDESFMITIGSVPFSGSLPTP